MKNKFYFIFPFILVLFLSLIILVGCIFIFNDLNNFLNSFEKIEHKKPIEPDWEKLNFIETSEIILKNRIKDKLEILDYSSFVYEKAKKKNIDPYLVIAAGYTESNFNIHAYGSAGEKGIFQFMPSTAKWLLKDKYKWNIEKDLYQSTNLWFLYYERLSKLYNGNSQLALLGYNMGEGRLNFLLKRYNFNVDTVKYIIYHKKNWKPYDEKVEKFVKKFKENRII